MKDPMLAEIERLTAENERLRAVLLEIAGQNKWSEIALDSQGAHTGLAIVNEMQTIARRALKATP